MKGDKENKKICILSAVYPTPFNIRVFYKEAETLVEAGYNVTLIAQHNKNEIVDGVKIIALPKPKNQFLRIFKASWKVFWLALKQKADVYHFHNPELIPTGILLKIFRRARVIYDVHEDVPKQILTKRWVPPHLRAATSKLAVCLEKIGLFVFDVIIVAAEDIANHFPSSHKIIVVRNFPLLGMVGKLKKREGNRKRLTTLINVGTLDEERCLNEMITMTNYVGSNIKLLLVGKFSTPQLEREFEKKTTEKIEFIRYVPHKKIYQYLKEADIGLFLFYPTPNHMECCWRNTKLFEYMAAGLPIVASNFSQWKEVIEGNNWGITVNPLNPKEIAKAVEYLVEYPEEARRMGENGRKAVLEKYNWENESKKLLKVYQKLFEN